MGSPGVTVNCWTPGFVCEFCVGGEKGWGVRLFDVVVSEDVARQTEQKFVTVLAPECCSVVCLVVDRLGLR